jgi:hypothetical protein
MTRPVTDEAVEQAAFAWFVRGGELDAESREARGSGDRERANALAREALEAFGLGSRFMRALDHPALPPLVRPPDPIGLA